MATRKERAAKLLALHVCPRCRRDLRPVHTGEVNVWACVTCDATYTVGDKP